MPGPARILSVASSSTPMFLFLPLLVVDILLSLFINMDKVQFVDNTLPLEVLAFLRSFTSRSLPLTI